MKASELKESTTYTLWSDLDLTRKIANLTGLFDMLGLGYWSQHSERVIDKAVEGDMYTFGQGRCYPRCRMSSMMRQ